MAVDKLYKIKNIKYNDYVKLTSPNNWYYLDYNTFITMTIQNINMLLCYNVVGEFKKIYIQEKKTGQVRVGLTH